MHVMPPKPNTSMSRYFCFLGMRSVFKIGSGKIVVQMSVMMLNAALENLQHVSHLMQYCRSACQLFTRRQGDSDKFP